MFFAKIVLTKIEKIRTVIDIIKKNTIILLIPLSTASRETTNLITPITFPSDSIGVDNAITL